jgi:membrane protease YdiL (CAAX protease family)
MAAAIYLTLLALVWIAVISSGVLWTRFLIRCSRSQASFRELVPPQRRQQPFWTLADFLLMFGTLLTGLIFISAAFAAQGWIDPPAENGDPPSLHSLVGNLVANALAGILAVAVTMSWLCALFRQDAMKQLGLIPNWPDVLLGLRAALWLLPPIGVISLVVALLIPYEHPVLDTLAESPTLALFGLMFLGTAIVAPVVEEFMFRVMLQGSLERLAESWASDPAGRTATLPAVGDAAESLANGCEPTAENWAPTFYWPMVVASLIFAIMHYGQGGAPIPLFVLSLGLGFLYRQTGRITAPLVVHMVLNTTTLLVEFSRMLAGLE